jgi:hypothetical protein
MRACPTLFWTALGRALFTLDGRESIRDWLRWVIDAGNPKRAWRGLREALVRTRPDRYREILEAGAKIPALSGVVCEFLEEDRSGDPGRADGR